MAAIERHFPASITAPQYIFIQSPHDLRTTKGLADLEQMAQRVAQLPDIATVRGVTRPTGVPLEQATLSFQAGEIGNKLAEATSKITDSTDERAALTGGADKPPQPATVRSQLTRSMSMLQGLSKTLSGVRNQIASSEELQKMAGGDELVPDMASIDDAVASNDSTLESMKNDPNCDPDPQCASERDRLQRTSDMLHQLRPSLESATKAIRALGLNNPNGLQQQVETLDQGRRRHGRWEPKARRRVTDS